MSVMDGGGIEGDGRSSATEPVGDRLQVTMDLPRRERPPDAPPPVNGTDEPSEELTPAERRELWWMGQISLLVAMFVGGLAFYFGLSSYTFGTRLVFFTVGVVVTALFSYIGLVMLTALQE